MLYLYGASGHGKVILEIAEELEIAVDGFVDENRNLKNFMGCEVFHELPFKDSAVLISIGDNKIRKKVKEKLSEAKFPSLIHPKTAVSKRSLVGEGTVIMAGVAINSEATVGKHCIINTNASIDHDCVLGNYVHISPNVALAGNVHVGEGTHIGIGSSVIQGIKIGNWVTIGAGAVIIKDVPDHAVVVGNPGRIIKYKNV